MSLSGRQLTLTLAGVLAVVLVLGAGAAFAIGRAQRVDVADTGSSTTGGPAAGSSATTGGGSTPPDETSHSAPADGAPTPSADTGSSGSTGPAVSPSPNDGRTPSGSPDDPVQVTLSPSAEASPHAAEVTGLIRRYFTAINRHDFEAWLATVSTGQAKRDPDDWLGDYKTTYDSNIYISDINEGDPLTVRMQFTSHQSVELAPSGLKEPCVRWDVTYRILDEGTGLRVGTSAKSPSMAACT